MSEILEFLGIAYRSSSDPYVLLFGMMIGSVITAVVISCLPYKKGEYTWDFKNRKINSDRMIDPVEVSPHKTWKKFKSRQCVPYVDCDEILKLAELCPQEVKNVTITYDKTNDRYLFYKYTGDAVILVKIVNKIDDRYLSVIQNFLSNEE